jgi:hypothetical protein
MSFLKRRLGFDVSYYNNQNINQISAIPLSTSTGYGSALLNAGTIENKGWEVQFNATPFKTADFRWDLNLNGHKQSLVVELLNGIENFIIASLGGILSTQLQGNLMERSEVVIIFTLLMANYITKQDLRIEIPKNR